MANQAQPAMVTMLREARGWTQAMLGDAAKLTQGAISKIERGDIELKGERLAAVARALEAPEEIFTRTPYLPGIEVTCLHRRRASTMSVGVVKRIEALTHLTRISVEGILDGVELAPEKTLRRIDAIEADEPANVARELRRLWELPSGPIANLSALVESAGVVIVIRPFGTKGQDAVSTWPSSPGRAPLMIVNAGLSPDRLRFTIAHELGHLVMHGAPTDNQENQANTFAGEFLAPSAEIGPDLADLTTNDFRRLMTLKSKWGLSMSALIRRAHDLDMISDRQYREFYMRLGKLGWRTSEPGEVAAEHPRSVDRIMKLQRERRGYSTADLARMAGMTQLAFERHYLADQDISWHPKEILRLELTSE